MNAARASSGLFAPHDEPHCDACGFALVGLPEHGNCPECGAAYTPASARALCKPPTVTRALGYFAWPALSIAIAIAYVTARAATSRTESLDLFCVMLVLIPCSIAWLGWRTVRFTGAFKHEVLPRRVREGGGRGALGCLVEIFGALLFGGGIILTAAGLLLFAVCVADFASYGR